MHIWILSRFANMIREPEKNKSSAKVVVNLSTHYKHTGENNWGDNSPHKRYQLRFIPYLLSHILWQKGDRMSCGYQNPVNLNVKYREHYNLGWGTKMTYVSTTPDSINKSEVVCNATSKCFDLAWRKWLQDTRVANTVPTKWFYCNGIFWTVLWRDPICASLFQKSNPRRKTSKAMTRSHLIWSYGMETFGLSWAMIYCIWLARLDFASARQAMHYRGAVLSTQWNMAKQTKYCHALVHLVGLKWSHYSFNTNRCRFVNINW